MPVSASCANLCQRQAPCDRASDTPRVAHQKHRAGSVASEECSERDHRSWPTQEKRTIGVKLYKRERGNARGSGTKPDCVVGAAPSDSRSTTAVSSQSRTPSRPLNSIRGPALWLIPRRHIQRHGRAVLLRPLFAATRKVPTAS